MTSFSRLYLLSIALFSLVGISCTNHSSPEEKSPIKSVQPPHLTTCNYRQLQWINEAHDVSLGDIWSVRKQDLQGETVKWERESGFNWGGKPIPLDTFILSGRTVSQIYHKTNSASFVLDLVGQTGPVWVYDVRSGIANFGYTQGNYRMAFLPRYNFWVSLEKRIPSLSDDKSIVNYFQLLNEYLFTVKIFRYTYGNIIYSAETKYNSECQATGLRLSLPVKTNGINCPAFQIDSSTKISSFLSGTEPYCQEIEVGWKVNFQRPKTFDYPLWCYSWNWEEIGDFPRYSTPWEPAKK